MTEMKFLYFPKRIAGTDLRALQPITFNHLQSPPNHLGIVLPITFQSPRSLEVFRYRRAGKFVIRCLCLFIKKAKHESVNFFIFRHWGIVQCQKIKVRQILTPPRVRRPETKRPRDKELKSSRDQETRDQETRGSSSNCLVELSSAPREQGQSTKRTREQETTDQETKRPEAKRSRDQETKRSQT